MATAEQQQKQQNNIAMQKDNTVTMIPTVVTIGVMRTSASVVEPQQLNCTQRVPMITAPTIQAAVMVESARITTAHIQQAQHQQLRDV